MERCFDTAWRVMSKPRHSSPSVCPFFACSRSSSRRRLASASARKTASSVMLLICNHLVACQAARSHRDPKLSGGRSQQHLIAQPCVLGLGDDEPGARGERRKAGEAARNQLETGLLDHALADLVAPGDRTGDQACSLGAVWAQRLEI